MWTWQTFNDNIWLTNICLLDYKQPALAPGISPRGFTLFFCLNFRQPPNDVEMALGGTLLPSISTFASGPTIKSKSIGNANLVSILWSLHIMRAWQKNSTVWGKKQKLKKHQRIGCSVFLGCLFFQCVSPMLLHYSQGLTPRSNGACTSLHRLL